MLLVSSEHVSLSTAGRTCQGWEESRKAVTALSIPAGRGDGKVHPTSLIDVEHAKWSLIAALLRLFVKVCLLNSP